MFTQGLKISVYIYIYIKHWNFMQTVYIRRHSKALPVKTSTAPSHFPVCLKPIAPQAFSVTFRSWRNTFEHNVRRLSSQKTICAWERAFWISWWCSFTVFFWTAQLPLQGWGGGCPPVIFWKQMHPGLWLINPIIKYSCFPILQQTQFSISVWWV